MSPNHHAGANADCPLSLWMVWVIQRLSGFGATGRFGVAQLWIVRRPARQSQI